MSLGGHQRISRRGQMSEEPEPKAAAGIIPSLYYDLIARVLPGGAVVAPVLMDYRELRESAPEGWAGFLVFLGASYVTGTLADPIRRSARCTVGIVIRSWLGIEQNTSWTRLGAAFSRRSDRISEKNAEAGTTLRKMQAETVLAANLVVGYVAIWAYFVASRSSSSHSPIATYFTGRPWRFHAGALLVLFVAAWFRQAAYLHRQKALYDLYA